MMMFLFFLILLAVQVWIHPNFGDDVIYTKVCMAEPLGAFLRDRYETWSSRIIIEAVMMALVSVNPWVWRLLNIVMILLLVWITADLFGIGNKLQARILFFAVMWIVPFYSLSNAGWITTTVNYLWCLTTGLIAMRPMKHWISGEKCPKWEYLICPFCLLYAANMEQMAAILLGGYLVLGCYLWVEKKQISPFYVIQLMLIAASLCFILTAPGNQSRTAQEMERFFPEFANMNIGEKLEMGFLETAHYYIAGGYDKSCYLFACLTGVLFLCLVSTKMEKDRTKRVNGWGKVLIAGIPLTAYWCFAHLFRFLLQEIHITHGRNFFGVLSENRQIPGQSYFPGALVVLQMLVYLAVLFCVMLTIFFLHGKSKETLLQYLILTAGFGSRCIMGFSPTIYASEDRTALFCTMAILIVIMRNLQLWMQKKPGRGWKAAMGVYVGYTVICNVI